jgi:hypothetical protein
MSCDLTRSNVGALGSNPTRGLDVCVLIIIIIITMFGIELSALQRANIPSKEFYRLYRIRN